MDFETFINYPYSCSTGGDCGYLENGCYVAGFIYDIPFISKTVSAKVRFKNNVRNFEIYAKVNCCEISNAGFRLYFSQSDFDNYSGALRLPKNSSDTQGKLNLRLSIMIDNDPKSVRKVTPQLIEWDPEIGWIVTYRQANWIANSTTTIFLSDAEAPLPVKLASISAASTPEGNHISWKTTEETDFSHFEIENSEDPRQGFQYLAKVLSGNNALGGVYHYTHVLPPPSQQYYRLKMVDFDGTFEYSKIVAAGRDVMKDNLVVYPNPAQNLLFLKSLDVVRSVTLVDQKGTEVFSKFFWNGGKLQTIILPKLNSGAYYLKVNPETGDQQVREVIVK